MFGISHFSVRCTTPTWEWKFQCKLYCYLFWWVGKVNFVVNLLLPDTYVLHIPWAILFKVIVLNSCDHVQYLAVTWHVPHFLIASPWLWSRWWLLWLFPSPQSCVGPRGGAPLHEEGDGAARQRVGRGWWPQTCQTPRQRGKRPSLPSMRDLAPRPPITCQCCIILWLITKHSS